MTPPRVAPSRTPLGRPRLAPSRSARNHPLRPNPTRPHRSVHPIHPTLRAEGRLWRRGRYGLRYVLSKLRWSTLEPYCEANAHSSFGEGSALRIVCRYPVCKGGQPNSCFGAATVLRIPYPAYCHVKHVPVEHQPYCIRVLCVSPLGGEPYSVLRIRITYQPFGR